MRRQLTSIGLLLLLGCKGQIDAPSDAIVAGGPGPSSGSGASPGTGTGAGPAASGGSGSSSSSGQGGSGSSPASGGTSGTVSNPDPAIAPVTFTCDPALVPESAPLRRLTRVQYANTLADLLTFALGDRNAALSVESALAATLAALPADERPKLEQDLHGTYRRLDQGVGQSHVDAWYEVGVRAGLELTSPERISAVVGSCATDDAATDGCLDAFIERFGARALRRPLTTEEVAFYRGFYGDTGQADSAGYADVIGAFLSAPEFLYVVESGAAAVSGQTNGFELAAFELASRLSYHFWNTMPDAELWDRASDGTLLDATEYARQVERLFADARTRSAVRDFYREWLKLEDLPPLDEANGVPIYDAFTGEDRPSSMLSANMQNEVLDLLEHLSWESPSGIDQILTTQLIYPRTDDLARIYGVMPVTAPVTAPNGERPGLLTRAAFLATGSERTRPIKKGVFIRENMLCDHIQAPPANALQNLPELAPDLSTRETVEAITSTGTCAGCHTTQINDLGFPTESYDALGRFRTEERIFDPQGQMIAMKPVDTTATPQIVEEDLTVVTDAAELMDLVVESNKAPACLARHYFRYSFGRFENVAQDGCALEQLRTALVDSNSLSGMLKEVALAPEFRRRTIVQ